MTEIRLLRGTLSLPAFFPDATYASVKAASAEDLRGACVDGIEISAYHLYTKPGIGVIKKHGGIHAFMGWDGPILTDSGGFQIFSLIRQNPKYGSIHGDKILYRSENGDRVVFTPQKSIQLQFAVKSDIIVCLDYCTDPADDYETQEKAALTTVRWAGICRREYDKLLKEYKYGDDTRPLLFAVIQGGNDIGLRRKCAAELVSMGFDGYGYGGWPIGADGRLMDDMLAQTAALMPENAVKYAMGMGRPDEIVRLHKMGYNLFDCVIPTREARHHRLYVFNAETPDDIDITASDFYSYVRIMDDKYAADATPVSGVCDCALCTRYSKAYLRHLFKTNDPLAPRLATIHNLRFYSSVMERLRT